MGTAQLVEYRAQASIAMGRKLQCLLDRVNEPAEHYFGSTPTPITFQQLLDGDGFLMERVGGIQGAKEAIDGVEQDAAGDAAAMSGALHKVAKVIHIDISVSKG